MASIIKLKRGLTSALVPASLQEGELAVNLPDRKLFIGGQNGGANVVTISGDQYNLASAGSGNTATVSLTVDNDALSNDSITFVGGTNVSLSESGGTITISSTSGGGLSESPLLFNSTANQVTATKVGNTVTVSLADNVTIPQNLTVSGNTHIDGNLTVEGELTYISSSTVQIDDGMVKLTANNIADTVDHGVYSKYIESGTEKFSGYFRDASSSSTIFKFYTDLEVEPTSTVNESGAGYALAQVDAIIDGGTY